MIDDLNAERLLTLETKVAYQDKLIADLNDVLLERGQQLDALEGRVEALARLMREGPQEAPSNEPPPHY